LIKVTRGIAMKLVAFSLCGRDRIGAVVNSHVVDLNAACSASLEAAGELEPAGAADRILPADMLGFLRAGDAAKAAARSALRFVAHRRMDVLGAVYPLECVRLRAPVPRPPKIVCTGVNCEDYRQIIGLAKSPVPLSPGASPSTPSGPGGPGS
jgi:acylpyruvate hydrolase